MLGHDTGSTECGGAVVYPVARWVHGVYMGAVYGCSMGAFLCLSFVSVSGSPSLARALVLSLTSSEVRHVRHARSDMSDTADPTDLTDLTALTGLHWACSGQVYLGCLDMPKESILANCQ